MFSVQQEVCTLFLHRVVETRDRQVNIGGAGFPPWGCILALNLLLALLCSFQLLEVTAGCSPSSSCDWQTPNLFHLSVSSSEKWPGQRFFLSYPCYCSHFVFYHCVCCPHLLKSFNSALRDHSHNSGYDCMVILFYVTCIKKEPVNICCHGFCDKYQTYPDFTNFILVLSWSSSALLSVEGQASVRWGISGNGEIVPC